ncbi:MAG: outer membrane lipoprotein chaperone LolA [Myxococcota bacterium]|nr:outer membrane lipoprotein chaperone LolA [Myxococcota bacterium]
MNVEGIMFKRRSIALLLVTAWTLALGGLLIARPAASKDTSKNPPKVENQSKVGNPPKVGDIISKLSNFYASTQDYAATFVQTTAHKMFAGKLQRAYGAVKFKKGGLMRWEYTRPEKKLFIYDGKTLWIYEPEVPQVFSGTADTERLRRALAFLTGETPIQEEYQTKRLDEKKYGFPNGIVLGLWPKDARSPFRRVEVYLNSSTFQVVRSVVVDHDGNRNRFDFSNPAVNRGLSKELFSFTPPAGLEVIKAP